MKKKLYRINKILSAFNDGEKLKGVEIEKRVNWNNSSDGNLPLFIYNNMEFQFLNKENVEGLNYYSKI